MARRSPSREPVSGTAHSCSAPISSAAATRPSADSQRRYSVVLCTPERSATASTVSSAYPRSPSSSRVALSAARRVRSVRPPGRFVPEISVANCYSCCVSVSSMTGTVDVADIAENNHHIREFGVLRDRLLRHLVTERGFTVLGFEGGFAEGHLVDAWLRGGPGE